jgi:hypothetical protein
MEIRFGGGIRAGRSWRDKYRGAMIARCFVDAGKYLLIGTLRSEEEFARLALYMGDALVELRDCGVSVRRDVRPS